MLVSFRDTARTIRHKPLKLAEHVDRLFRSMRYIGIDADLSREEMVSISEEVLERNLHLIAPDEDYWLFQRVSPGVADPCLGEEAAEPTVIVECTPLPLKARAALYRDGVHVQVPGKSVIPAKAGIHFNHESLWISAFVSGFVDDEQVRFGASMPTPCGMGNDAGLPSTTTS